MLSMWFKHDAVLIMMIEILKMKRHELSKADFPVKRISKSVLRGSPW